MYAISLQWHESRKGSRDRPFFLAAFKVLRRGRSHPSRVCGLKQLAIFEARDELHVTPFAGVWIETCTPAPARRHGAVTPFAGVWIETAAAR
ncbi:hypothetical protein V6768_20795, partial [Tistrella mobilis]